MTPEIINRGEFIVVGTRTVAEIGDTDTDALWKTAFLPRYSEVPTDERRYYGVFNFLQNDPEGRIEYVAGVVTDSLENIPVGMVGWVVPGGKYAEITAVGQTGVAKACRDLMTEWLPDSGYQRMTSPMFAYTSDGQPDSPKAVWKVNIPIETPEELAQYETWLSEN